MKLILVAIAPSFLLISPSSYALEPNEVCYVNWGIGTVDLTDMCSTSIQEDKAPETVQIDFSNPSVKNSIINTFVDAYCTEFNNGAEVSAAAEYAISVVDEILQGNATREERSDIIFAGFDRSQDTCLTRPIDLL